MSRTIDTGADRVERGLLVQVILGHQSRDTAADSLYELERLADTAGAVVVGRVTQRRDRPAPGTLLGQGKLGEVQMACKQASADLEADIAALG